MPGVRLEDLSDEAREALLAARRAGFRRSLAIAFGFSLPFSFIQRWVPAWVSILAFGAPMGLGMGWLHASLLDRLRHRSFLVTIVRQTVMYALTVGLSLSLSMFLVIGWGAMAQGTTSGMFAVWAEIMTNPWYLLSLAGAVVLVLPIRFVHALGQKLGPGVLGKWLRGYYHEPREEERIFMFLDMKDSTTLAEQLGNLRFSALVRDFFEDLTLPVLQTHAEVSHYIGDEAVLTWTIPKGRERANCLRLFFEFERAIARRAPYYRSAYGFVPEFKAGAHAGTVVATEVGEVKSEIVYHGDVLNTAARIQGLCNDLNERFLISGELAELLSPFEFASTAIGERELKGKSETVEIVAIGSKETSPSR